MDPIPYARPSITDLEVDYAADAARHGWGNRCYEYIHRFEEEFRIFVGTDHAIATSSCTGALHLGLAALGISEGDEVILADANWIASVAPVVHLKATPIFVDIDPDSWCIDPDSVVAAITPKTKAIVAVHLYGNLCAMDRLLAIGLAHGIPVIEDAAEAIGSRWQGRHAGSLGRIGVFSFHGTKTMTTGEGGMLVTSDQQLFQRALMFSNHGRSPGGTRQFWPDEVGYKFKISNIQAAIGCAQVQRLDELIAEKRRIFLRYRDGLAWHRGLRMNPEPADAVNGFWMPTVVFPPATVGREFIQQAFQRAAIDARVFFWPLSSLPPFGSGPGRKVAADIASRAINLPSYHGMSDEHVDRTLSVIKELCP